MHGDPDPEITINSMFADPVHQAISERARLQRELNAEVVRELLGDPAIDSEVSRFLRESLGYDPAVVYKQD
jgi:hypothetical protein